MRGLEAAIMDLILGVSDALVLSVLQEKGDAI